MIDWKVSKGKEPRVEEYIMTIHVHTFVSQTRTVDQIKVKVTLPPTYPTNAPIIQAIGEEGQSRPYNPNWHRDGKYCGNIWNIKESLGNHIVRMIQTLQYDPLIINPGSAANGEANSWYLNNKERFPCDTQPLPSFSTVSGFRKL